MGRYEKSANSDIGAELRFNALEALFVEIPKLGDPAGPAMVGTIALDGTEVKANALRQKATGYDRMKQHGRMKQKDRWLQQEIVRLLAGV